MPGPEGRALLRLLAAPGFRRRRRRVESNAPEISYFVRVAVTSLTKSTEVTRGGGMRRRMNDEDHLFSARSKVLSFDQASSKDGLPNLHSAFAPPLSFAAYPAWLSPVPDPPPLLALRRGGGRGTCSCRELVLALGLLVFLISSDAFLLQAAEDSRPLKRVSGADRELRVVERRLDGSVDHASLSRATRRAYHGATPEGNAMRSKRTRHRQHHHQDRQS